MKLTLGAQDKKKIGILGALLAVAGIVFFINSSDSPPASPPSPSRPTPTVPLVAPRRAAESQSTAPGASRTAAGQRGLQDFRPSLKPKKPEDRPDPMTIDPTLRLEVMAKLQAVNVEGTHRSIFDFGQAPPPPQTAAAKPKTPVPSPLVGPQQAQDQKPAQPPAPPPPPPIPLKFYGFITARNQAVGPKRAFFLEGDEIHVVTEGDVVKKRYKIVRIGVNSVIVEDLDQKNQQTLPLEAAPAG